jgi:hypothetical protein
MCNDSGWCKCVSVPKDSRTSTTTGAYILSEYFGKVHESFRLSRFMERVEVCPSIISSVLRNEFEVGGECLPREVVRLMRHGRDELS